MADSSSTTSAPGGSSTTATSSSGGGGSSADSYIGSVISLTSKSEIRYEGILYTVDTANSNIALQDVRSFGTEGRKKDGPQIPPSDKVYDYIIFRGTDIKDLQVKSSPQIRPTQPPHHDPAIISLQSQYTPPAPSPAAGTLTEGLNPGPYSNVSSAPFRSNLPSLYQPAPGLGSWAVPQVPPGTNGSLGMPMYWQGYYRPPGGMSHLQQQSPIPYQALPTLPPNYLSQAQSLAQQHLSVAASTQELSTSVGSQMAPLLQPNLPAINTKDSSVTTAVSQAAPLLQPSLSLLNTRDSLVTTAATSDLATSNTSLPGFASSSQVIAPLVDTALTPALEERVAATLLASKIPQSMALPVVSTSQSLDSLLGQSTVHLSTPSLSTTMHTGITSETLKQSSIQTHSSPAEQTLVEPSTTTGPLISTLPSSQSSNVTNQPLLPLPVNPVRQKQVSQANGSLPGNMMYMRRGRGRGRGTGSSQSQKQFTEDFDFTAMNEKFNKDEVWGELGKGDLRDKGDGEESVTEDYHEEEDLPRMPVYVKDDFFDSLSCDALGRGGQGERTKFSEQRKIDTETFGSFSLRSRSGRGGRSGYRGGYRGGYHGGRGAGNGGRGRSFPRNATY